MKNSIIILILAVSFGLNAQNFQGKAIYKTSRKSNIKLGNDNQMTDAMKAQIHERLRKMNQKTYTLEFDKTSSIYKEESKLNSPKLGSQGGIHVVSIGGGGSGSGIFYKNIKEKRFVNQTEIQGKRFLIKDKLEDFDWQLSSETKNIGQYTCYKATFSRDVEKVTSVVQNEKLVKKTEKETVVTTAWYTPQIPVSNGPKNYQGLPGLILEVNDGTTIMVCTEIVLDKNKITTINEPKKGKKVSQKEYLAIKKKKSEEMLEKFKSRNGYDMGNGVRVKVSN